MATVLGVPLNEGERVFYSNEEDTKMARIIQGVIAGVLLVFGLITLIFVVGVVFLGIGGWMLYKVFKPDMSATVGIVLTNQRFIAVPLGPEEPIVSFPTGQIEDADVVREKARARGGGLVGALASAAANAYLDHQANKAGRLVPKYWERCKAIKLQVDGQSLEVSVPEKSWGQQIGPLLIGGIEDGWDSLTEVSFEAQRQHLP